MIPILSNPAGHPQFGFLPIFRWTPIFIFSYQMWAKWHANFPRCTFYRLHQSCKHGRKMDWNVANIVIPHSFPHVSRRCNSLVPARSISIWRNSQSSVTLTSAVAKCELVGTLYFFTIYLTISIKYFLVPCTVLSVTLCSYPRNMFLLWFSFGEICW